MKNAILVHGWGSKAEFYDPECPTASNAHWFPWLSKQLMIRDIHTMALEMPNSYYPEYEIWKKELERFDINEETLLVGHSCGGGFLVRYLSENDVKVGKVILVAPWLGILGLDGDDHEDVFDETFFEFEIDRELAAKTHSLTLIESTNDMSQVQESIQILKNSIDNMKIVTLENKGHFTLDSLGTVGFPELLAEALI
jgi:predicted alpha/beta hydrolase family esterase